MKVGGSGYGGVSGVGVSVGRGVTVVGMRDGVRLGVRVRVAVGGRVVGVRLGTLVGVDVIRALRVPVGVIVTNPLGVSEGTEVGGTSDAVLVGVTVAVGTKTVTICSVRAAAVSKLATARSTIFSGSSVIGI